MTCTRCKIAVILQRQTKCKMVGLGIIATGAAFLNMRKRKKEYEELVEKREGLVAAINAYNSSSYDAYINSIDTKETDAPAGVTVTTLLRVANLVGKLMRVRASIILTNTGTKPIYIHSVAADCKIFGEYLGIGNTDGVRVSQEIVSLKELQPGDPMEIQLRGGICQFKEISRLREAICAAAGKRLITSCPKLNLEGIEQADIRVRWSEADDMANVKEWRVLNKPGVLRYCGEAGLG